jgi:hypothetical protein
VGFTLIMPILMVPAVAGKLAAKGWSPNPLAVGVFALVYAVILALFFTRLNASRSKANSGPENIG